MPITTNGGSGAQPTRRLRFDPSTVRLARSRRYSMGTQHSGRRFVLVALVSVGLLWGALYVLFRDWRARYLERAVFGRSKVATAIDPLAALTPTGINPDEWRQAVDETREMLRTVTGSNILDATGMDRLRTELTARVAHADAHTAQATLIGIWDYMDEHAGHIIDRHKRPKLLQKAKPKEAQR